VGLRRNLFGVKVPSAEGSKEMHTTTVYEIETLRKGSRIGVAIMEARNASEAISQLRREARRDGLGVVDAGTVKAVSTVTVVLGDPAAKLVSFKDAAYWQEP
jgi:hypothetical protein